MQALIGQPYGSALTRRVASLFADMNLPRAATTNHRMLRRTKEVTMSRLKSAVVAAIGTVAVAGFAMAFATPGAMAAGQKGVVPHGQVKFFVDSPSRHPSSPGLSMSARQKQQGYGALLVPAVQRLRH
jgi:hypothetical protein